MGKMFFALMLSVSLFFNIFLLSRNKNKDQGVLVVGTIDGDTIVLEDNKTRVRLRYVDAPEEGLCGSQEADDLLKQLTVGKRVHLTNIVPDKYGRGMALIYLGNKLINQEMVASGWVRYHSDETVEKEEIKKVSEEAKNNLSGIYGKCLQKENTTNPKCNIKGNIAPNNSEEKIYQLPGCVQYSTTTVDLDRGESWFCTEAEAKKAGFVKSKRCL